MTTIPVLTVLGTVAGFFALLGTLPRRLTVTCTAVSGAALVTAGVAAEQTWQRLAYLGWAVLVVGLSVRRLRARAPGATS